MLSLFTMVCSLINKGKEGAGCAQILSVSALCHSRCQVVRGQWVAWSLDPCLTVCVWIKRKAFFNYAYICLHSSWICSSCKRLAVGKYKYIANICAKVLFSYLGKISPWTEDVQLLNEFHLIFSSSQAGVQVPGEAFCCCRRQQALPIAHFANSTHSHETAESGRQAALCWSHWAAVCCLLGDRILYFPLYLRFYSVVSRRIHSILFCKYSEYAVCSSFTQVWDKTLVLFPLEFNWSIKKNCTNMTCDCINICPYLVNVHTYNF